MNKNLLKELKKEVERLNNDEDFEGIYDFELKKEDGEYYLIDHTEESYYERVLLETFEKICDKYDYFLECEVPGRYVICE